MFESIKDAVNSIEKFKGKFLSTKKNMSYDATISRQISTNEDISDINDFELLVIKKALIPKGRIFSLCLKIKPLKPDVFGQQSNVISDNPDLEIKNPIVTIDNSGEIKLSVMNMSQKSIRLLVDSKFGSASIIPDLEMEFSKTFESSISLKQGKFDIVDVDDIETPKVKSGVADSTDIDMFLLSSDEEENAEEILEAVKTRVMSHTPTANASPHNDLKVKVSFFSDIPGMISSYDDFKKRMNILDHNDCITGSSTPEILKTSATREFMTELKESLDKSFDAVTEFDVDHMILDDPSEISDPVSINLPDLNSTSILASINEKLKQKSVAKPFKTRSSFKECAISPSSPLIPQIKSLAALLKEVEVIDDLGEHFPSILGQEHLSPVCEMLAKYVRFSQSSFAFDICDIGDKLVCEIASLAISNLDELSKSLNEIHDSQPEANLDVWVKLFSDKFESFQGINDLLGEDFDKKAIQIVLLTFADKFTVGDGQAKESVTSLIGILDKIENIESKDECSKPSFDISQPLQEEQMKSDLIDEKINDFENSYQSFTEDEHKEITKDTVLEHFDMKKNRDKIYIAAKTGDDDNTAMIIVNKAPVFVQLDNIFCKTLLRNIESDTDLYLVKITDTQTPTCELALSLSAWHLQTLKLFQTGFILYQLPTEEFLVAIIKNNEIVTVSLNKRLIKKLDDQESSNCLKAGLELKLIVDNEDKIVICVLHPDGRIWNPVDVTNFAIDNDKFVKNIDGLATWMTLPYKSNKKLMLLCCSDQGNSYESQRILLKAVNKSSEDKKSNLKSFSRYIPANIQASRRELFAMKNILLVTSTSIILSDDMVKVVGENEATVKTAIDCLVFNLSKSKKNKSPTQPKFIEHSLGEQLVIHKGEKISIKFKLKDDNIENYKIHPHFDSRDLSGPDFKLLLKEDKTILLEINNNSSKTVTIEKNQKIILLEKILEKSTQKKVEVVPTKLSLALDKIVNINAKSVAFVETSVIDKKTQLKQQDATVVRHPDFRNPDIFIPDKQVRTVSSSGKVKISIRNKTENECKIAAGTIVAQINLDKKEK